MKRIIFIYSFLVSFQSITVYTIDNAKNKNFENIKDFLDSTNINEPEKNNIIAHFNRPEAGIPVWLKNQPKSKICNGSKIAKLFNLLFPKSNQPYPPKLKIDETATTIATELRKNTKLNPDAYIPIFTKNFKLSLKEKILDTFYFEYNPSDLVYKGKYPYITFNSLLNKLLPQSIAFRLAHEYAHIEMGNSATCKIAYLGIASVLFSYIFLINKKYNPLTSLVGSLGSSILSVFLSKGYFQQQEEKTCDLRAIELMKSDKGIEEFFLHELEVNVVFSNDDWIITEVKIKFDTPQEYTSWKERLFSSHPSNAERLRYCKDFAKECGLRNYQ